MKIFEDKGLLKEVIDTLSFEIVQAGDFKEKTFYVVNDTSAMVKDLNFELVHIESGDADNVEIVEAPNELPPQGVGELIIKWEASVELEQRLRMGLNITGRRLYG